MSTRPNVHTERRRTRSRSPGLDHRSERRRTRSRSPALDYDDVTPARSTSPVASKPDKYADGPPLPVEEVPPLPQEALPEDGWTAEWSAEHQAYYFYNRFTQVTQWENPRLAPSLSSSSAPGVGAYDNIPRAPGTTASSTAFSYSDPPPGLSSPPKRVHGGYNPAIHGDYDPTADYAIEAQQEVSSELDTSSVTDPSALYAAAGNFNRFTGKWQAATLAPENFNDENKSKRQMNAFFDVDAAANSHNGKSLREERQQKKLSKKEVKAFRDKTRKKKEEKRRAWLLD